MGQLYSGTPHVSPRTLPRVHTDHTQDGERQISYGLHSRCSALDDTCVPFPRETDCLKDPSFCNMWRTVGFLISFAVVIELCTLVSFVVIIGGGVQRRAAGWQVASGVLIFSAVVQCAGMAIVVCLFSTPHGQTKTTTHTPRLSSTTTTHASGTAGTSTPASTSSPPPGPSSSSPRSA